MRRSIAIVVAVFVSCTTAGAETWVRSYWYSSIVGLWQPIRVLTETDDGGFVLTGGYADNKSTALLKGATFTVAPFIWVP